MKKFLLSLVSLFMLTFAVKAGEPYKLLTFPDYNDTKVGGYTTEWTATVGEDVWTLNGFNNNNSKWDCVKCGRSGSEHTATITSPAVDKAITHVLVSVLGTKNVESVTLTVLNGEEIVGEPKDITESFVAGEVVTEVAGAAGYSYKLTVNSSAGSNGSTQIGKVALFEDGQFVEVHIANTAETAYTVAEAIELIEAGEALAETVYVKGIVSQVDKFNDTYKSIQYWISDDGTTTNQFECYSGKGIGGADFASIDDVKVGATVVVKGTLKKYNDVYEFNQNNELVSYEAPVEPEADYSGKYYLKNVATGLYWGAGNSWGTQASLVNEEQYVIFSKLEDGTYTLESMVSNGGNAYYFNGSYMDNDSPVHLTISEVGEGVYTISNGETFYGSDGASTVLASVAADSNGAKWLLLTQTDIEQMHTRVIASATQESPADVTFLITDAYFGRNRRDVSAWTIEAGNKSLAGGGDKGGCAESYHSTFTLSQVLANAPKGVYKLGASAFYRQDGSDNENLPYIYISDATNEAKSAFGPLTGSENSMNDAAAAFNAGNYILEPAFFEHAEEGDFTVGAKLETNTTLWAIWGRFTLAYYGPEANLAQIKFGVLVEQMENLVATATDLKSNEFITEAAAGELDDAIAATLAELATEDDYRTVISGLQTAIANAQAAIESNNIVKTGIVPNDKLDNWVCTNANTFHINTWSVEGNSDGSEMKTPFIENWVGKPGPLGEGTITYTVPGQLEAGKYLVKALVRVYSESGAEPAGATFFANDKNFDLAQGTAFEFNNMKGVYANVELLATVEDDGILKIGVEIASPTFNWVAIKDVTFQKKDIADYNYEQALKQIKANNFYNVTTTVGETTYYLTSEGTLTADVEAATAFEFKAVNIDGTFKPTGWNLGYRFTNPNLTNGSTGDVVNSGVIRPDAKNDRDDWERQVFFFDGEKFAVRSTNANGENWGANTYWDVIEGGELPTAGYALTAQYKFTLVDVTAAEALHALIAEIEATNAIVEAREGVGSALFQKSEEELATLAAAATTAQGVADNIDATAEQIQEARATLAAANKAYANGGTYPKADAKYTFQQKASGMYLALNESGVVLSAEPYELSWEIANDGWYITDGNLYVGWAGSNNWTMSSAPDKKMVINPTLAEIEGVVYYTLNEAKGLIATDGTEAGAACYTDKSVSGSGDKAYWTIAEVAEPVDPNDYTSYIINADLSDAASTAWNLEGTKGYHSVGGVVIAGNNAVYDFNQTIVGLPAGKYQVSVQAAYRYGADEQAEANAYFDDAIETKFAKLYATVGEKTVDVLVKNRYDGASDTDWANGEGSVVVEGKPVPNSTAAVKAWFDAKQYTNVLEFNLVEAGNVTIGIVKTAQPEAGDYTVIGPWTLTRIGDAETEPEPQEQVLNKEINVERYIGLGYTAQIETVDFTEALEFLGVEAVTYDMLRIVNPDDTEISDYAPYDGWFNGEGVAETWGANTKINVKFFEAIPDGEFSICDMNGADVVDAEYSVKWALVNGDKKVVYTVNVKFIEPEPVEIQILDNVIEASVDYETSEGSYVEKSVTLTDDQVAVICRSLGITSLDEASAYGYNPTTKELVVNYAGFDGWRDASGDFHNWTGDATVPACVKYTDGKTYLCYNIGGLEPQTIKCYWLVVANNKAITVEIAFNYVIPVGINGLNANLKSGNVFDIAGRKVSKIQKGGIYVVNGKKMMVK